ncbi:MAG: hypothetical protein HY291_03045 [Planctomycetes bacterium]|nr:hypothetical protein [Planctomycetota bacterium]
MDAKPRRWFQIHLSTALVLMLASGILLWANFSPFRDSVCTEGSYSEYVTIDKAVQREEIPKLIRDRHFGWPFELYVVSEYVRFQAYDWQAEGSPEFWWEVPNLPSFAVRLSENMCLWILILAGICFTSEFLTRRGGFSLFFRVRIQTVSWAGILCLLFAWANLRWQSRDIPTNEYDIVIIRERGWPELFQWQYAYWHDAQRVGEPQGYYPWQMDFTSMLEDTFLSTVVILGASSACEYFFRRREARKP